MLKSNGTMTATRLGRKDHQDGKKENDCPFGPGHHRQEWRKGFRAEAKKHVQAEIRREHNIE